MKKAALDASQAQRIMDLNQYLGIMNANTLFIWILAESQSVNQHSFIRYRYSFTHDWEPYVVSLVIGPYEVNIE